MQLRFWQTWSLPLVLFLLLFLLLIILPPLLLLLLLLLLFMLLFMQLRMLLLRSAPLLLLLSTELGLRRRSAPDGASSKAHMWETHHGNHMWRSGIVVTETGNDN